MIRRFDKSVELLFWFSQFLNWHRSRVILYDGIHTIRSLMVVYTRRTRKRILLREINFGK